MLKKLGELRNADAEGHCRISRFQNVPSTARMPARALKVGDEATSSGTNQNLEPGTWIPPETPQALWLENRPEGESRTCDGASYGQQRAPITQIASTRARTRQVRLLDDGKGRGRVGSGVDRENFIVVAAVQGHGGRGSTPRGAINLKLGLVGGLEGVENRAWILMNVRCCSRTIWRIVREEGV